MMIGGDISFREVKFAEVKKADVAVANLASDAPEGEKKTTIDHYIEAAVNFARKPNCGLWCAASEYGMALSRLSSPSVATRIYRTGVCAEVEAALRQAAINVFWSSDREIINTVRLGLAAYCQKDVSLGYWPLAVEKEQCVTERDDLKEQLAQCRAPSAESAKPAPAKGGKGKAPRRTKKAEPDPLPPPQHAECCDNRCVPVEGAGENQCKKDADCAPKPEPEKPKKGKVTELPPGEF